MSHKKSNDAFVRANRLMPGGVNSPARAFGAVGGDPIFIDRADGAYLFDIDGNRFVDFIGSWGPMILGHRHPAVLEAIEQTLKRGTSFGAPTLAENDLASMIVDAVPSIEKVRLVSSGTEATMSAIRLARGYTGRNAIVKFAGNYHGHADSLLVAAGSAAATLSVPNSPGVTPGTASDTIVLPYNDVETLTDTFAKHGDLIAGVIVEPIAGNMGCVKSSARFRETLRHVTQEHGSLLIFDEVISGFRVAYGGAQELFGITPDLTTLGKIIGGGLPVGAFGGSEEIMDAMLPVGEVFQAGTLSGNPLATAAGIATLTVLRDTKPYEQLEKMASTLAIGLKAAADKNGIPYSICRCGSMMTFFFNPEEVTDWEVAARSDTKAFSKYFWGLLERNIYMPCSQYESFFVSTAHTVEDIETTIAAVHEVFSSL